MHTKEEKIQAFGKLLDIMDELREKCPWDQKQTFESLRQLTVEEVYELSEAIDKKDLEEIKKEVGDILLHLIFYAKIASENQIFDIYDVIQSLCAKLIHRHPHIYGDVEVKNEQDVKRNWEALKLKEGNTSALSGVPKSLPALMKAMRIQEKARSTGFDWENAHQVWDKVQEELQEFKEEVDKSLTTENLEKEFGDLLFSLINYARFLNLDPEAALEKTNQKFIHRFQYMEAKVLEKGKNLHESSLAEMDIYWNEAKKSFY